VQVQVQVQVPVQVPVQVQVQVPVQVPVQVQVQVQAQVLQLVLLQARAPERPSLPQVPQSLLRALGEVLEAGSGALLVVG
jgi:hypothetical protein